MYNFWVTAIFKPVITMISSDYVNRTTKYVLTISAFLAVIGCAENPRLQVNTLDQSTAMVQFNLGPLIKEVDLDKAMRDYCGSLKAYVIREERIQLPGQYRFQKKVEFKCIKPE
jgi:hypothetical protein